MSTLKWWGNTERTLGMTSADGEEAAAAPSTTAPTGGTAELEAELLDTPGPTGLPPHAAEGDPHALHMPPFHAVLISWVSQGADSMQERLISRDPDQTCRMVGSSDGEECQIPSSACLGAHAILCAESSACQHDEH